MDPIFYASSTLYRVVVSHHPERPDIYYVDMCRDGFCSHDLLFQMQKKFYRSPQLERVFNDSKGIFLRESRNGDITLLYTKHRDIMAQKRQAELRAKVDGEIIRVFKQMKAEEKLQTISVQVHEFYYDNERPNIEKPARSLYEETARAKLLREEKAERLRKIKQEYYARQKYAAEPHIKLKLNQLWQPEY